MKKKLNFHLILVHPGFKSKTKEVYSKVKILRKKSKIRFKDFENTDKTTNLLIREKNDLQQIVENKHPRVTKIINFIQTQKGCFLSRITGSGSVCFGLFKSQKAAKKALKKIKKNFHITGVLLQKLFNYYNLWYIKSLVWGIAKR